MHVRMKDDIFAYKMCVLLVTSYLVILMCFQILYSTNCDQTQGQISKKLLIVP